MHRWKLSALAAAASVTAALTSTNAAALALGPISVQSALGEHLRAEIAIAQASEAELDSLAAQIASADIYRAQGLDYGQAARSVRIELNRAARTLRLSSDAPIQDPFVDLVVETQWSSGHLVRSYTLLLDPPAAQQRTLPPVTAARIETPAPAATPAAVPASTQASSTPATEPLSPAEAAVQVRKGDTASRIARAHLPEGVSLDQMLVAMLRSNPKAFINGNVNLIRAGAVLQMPSSEAAQQASAAEARKMVAAQTRDFHAYRRSLASKTQKATVQAADRSTSGQLQAQVSEPQTTTQSADKLTLSKSSAQSAAAEAQLAAQKQASEQDNRLTELQRNLAELSQLAESTTPVAAEGTAAAPESVLAPAPASLPLTSTEPGLSVEVATPPVASAPPEDAAPSSPVADASTTELPSTDASSTGATSSTAPQDSLRQTPWLPVGAGLIAVLLAALGYTRWKRRQLTASATPGAADDRPFPMETTSSTDASPAVDPAYTPDAVFHAADVTRPLAHTDTIDPVAEADMYLAYGRDVQAEEVLQTALCQQPAQLPVYVKLAEIYTKRQDSQALERLARDMQSAAPQPSPEWQQVMAMGMQLAPANAFFAAAAAAAAEAATDAAAMPTDATYATRPGNATSAVQAMPAAETSEAGDTPVAATVTVPNSLDLDIAGLNLPAAVQAEATAATAPVHVHEAPDAPLPAEDTATAVAPLEPEAGSLEVDLGSLDLDLGVPPTSAAPAQPVHNHTDDPLSTKLALAQEFQTIGDSEGARALIEEVLAQATGPLQARAQQMLSELN